jgi:hypothetical protein
MGFLLAMMSTTLKYIINPFQNLFVGDLWFQRVGGSGGGGTHHGTGLSHGLSHGHNGPKASCSYKGPQNLGGSH